MTVLSKDVKIFGKNYLAEIISENYDVEIVDYDLQQYGYYNEDWQERKADGYWNSNKFDKIYVIRGEHGNVWYEISTTPRRDWDYGVECVFLVRKNGRIDYNKFATELGRCYTIYECYCNGYWAPMFSNYMDYEETLLESFNDDNGTNFESVEDVLEDWDYGDYWDNHVMSWGESQGLYYECNGFDTECLVDMTEKEF